MLHPSGHQGKNITRRNLLLGVTGLTAGALLMKSLGHKTSTILETRELPVDPKDLRESIRADALELQQRMQLHEILSHPERNQWHNIVELKDETPFRKSEEKEYFRTKIPDLIVIFDTHTKNIQLAQHNKKERGDFIILLSADFPTAK